MRIPTPPIGESIYIAGNTNSGKTVLCKYLLSVMALQFRNVIIFQIDYDLNDPWEDYADIVVNGDLPIDWSLMDSYHILCVDATKLGKTKLRSLWGMVCGVALARGRTLLICDEIARVTDANSISENHFVMLSGRGRKRQTTLIQAGQRLQDCSIQIRTLSKHKFLFRLDDRDAKMYAKLFLDDWRLLLDLKPYHSLYIRPGFAGKTEVSVLPPCPLIRRE